VAKRLAGPSAIPCPSRVAPRSVRYWQLSQFEHQEVLKMGGRAHQWTRAFAASAGRLAGWFVNAPSLVITDDQPGRSSSPGAPDAGPQAFP